MCCVNEQNIPEFPVAHLVTRLNNYRTFRSIDLHQLRTETFCNYVNKCYKKLKNICSLSINVAMNIYLSVVLICALHVARRTP